jgi:hypothetical protein
MKHESEDRKLLTTALFAFPWKWRKELFCSPRSLGNGNGYIVQEEWGENKPLKTRTRLSANDPFVRRMLAQIRFYSMTAMWSRLRFQDFPYPCWFYDSYKVSRKSSPPIQFPSPDGFMRFHVNNILREPDASRFFKEWIVRYPYRHSQCIIC